MPITVESYLLGDEVLKTRNDYADGNIVYFVSQQIENNVSSGPIVTKGTIIKENYPHPLSRSNFAVAVWEDPKVEPTNEASHAIRAPYCVLTEEEILRAIAKAGGLTRADTERTVDELVISPTGNKELAPILGARLAEKSEF